jgi:Calreticulin family
MHVQPHCVSGLPVGCVALPSSDVGLLSGTTQVHLILRHKSPKTGEIEEKHLKLPPSVLLDDKTHVYTAVLHPNNT